MADATPTPAASGGKPSKPPSFIRRWIITLVAFCLLHARYGLMTLTIHNRRILFWTWRDTITLWAAVLVISFLVAAALHGLAKWTKGKSDRWLSPLFFSVCLLGLLNYYYTFWQFIGRQFPAVSEVVRYLLAWGTCGLLYVAACLSPRLRRWSAQGWRTLYYLFPVIVWCFLWHLTLPKWPACDEDPFQQMPPPGKTDEPPTILLLLDMLGYDEVFDAEGNVHPHLPHFRELAGTSTVYHHAMAPGLTTVNSLPGLFFQETVLYGQSGVNERRIYWTALEREDAPGVNREAFAATWLPEWKRQGGRPVYIGFYYPWHDELAGFWTAAWNQSFFGVEPEWTENTWIKSLLLHLTLTLPVSKDPVAAWSKQVRLYHGWERRYSRALVEKTLEVGRGYIQNHLARGDVLIWHVPLPHFPYIFDENGGFILRDDQLPREEGYLKQIQYTDKVLGDIMADLKAAGKWDESRILVFSDHGEHYRYWPDLQKKKHIPLFVKNPVQTEPRQIQTPINLTEIGARLSASWPAD